MSRELMQQSLKLLMAYQDCTMDSYITNKCGLIIKALEAELAKPEPVVSFTDNEEGLCIQLACNGSYYWQNLSESKTAKFFVDAYRGRK